MTVYFYCKACDFVKGYVNDDEPLECPDCKSKWYILRFGHEREDNSINIDGTSRGSERLSGVMSCLDSEIPKMMKAHPGSEYVKDGTGVARLRIKNRQHKKFEMKRRGYEEFE